MAGQDWLEKDFYKVLGVAQDASADEIKKAYRKLARQYHPDTNSGDAKAEQRFKEIGEAHSVLSDPDQRQKYDAVRAMRGGARFTAGGPGGGGDFQDMFGGLFGDGQRMRYEQAAGAYGAQSGPSLEDLLGMFGGGGPGGPAGPRAGGPGGFPGYSGPGAPKAGGRPGEDLITQTKLTFSQALKGSELSLKVTEGKNTRTIKARIPGGVKDGQKVRLRGKGRPSTSGGPAGDLVVTVQVEQHPYFVIDGQDVRLSLPVTFPELTLGTQIEVPTPHGKTVRLKVAEGTPNGRVFRVPGHGATVGGKTGDLLVKLEIVIPQRLDGDARQSVEAFAEATRGHNPRAGLTDAEA